MYFILNPLELYRENSLLCFNVPETFSDLINHQPHVSESINRNSRDEKKEVCNYLGPNVVHFELHRVSVYDVTFVVGEQSRALPR